MLVAPEKIRSGLVELRTKSGLVYVNPSFSERLYLLWTFRNFHRLPVEVLNRHQRQMIERLGQTAVVATQGRVPQSSLIGSVENVEIRGASEANAAAGMGKVVTISAPLTFMGKAAGSDAVATRPRRFKLARPLIRFPGKSRSPQGISASKVKAQAQPRKGRRARQFPQILIYQGSAKPLGIGLLVAGCLAFLLLYRREQRSASSGPVPQAAMEAPNPAPVSSTYIAVPEKGQLPTSVAREAKPIAVDSASSSSQPPAETRPPAELTNAVISTAPLVNPGQPDTLHRPHISEWPEGAFSYPIAPSRNLTGTVLLKAVIGINGAVTSVDILSGNRSLASAAAEAVWHWRYSPQQVNGIPTEAETNILIDFRGDDAVSVSFPAR